jgi:hypothetical protein
MSVDDLVNVLVPRRHLSQVYGFIARLDAGEGQATPASAAAEAGAPGPDGGGGGAPSDGIDEWTTARIRRMVEESPPAMIDILVALADRPGEWLTMEELAKAIRNKPDADWNTVAGTLGAFGNRVKNRYGLESWPFESRHDHKVGGRVSRMSGEKAEIVKRFIAGRKK